MLTGCPNRKHEDTTETVPPLFYHVHHETVLATIPSEPPICLSGLRCLKGHYPPYSTPTTNNVITGDTIANSTRYGIGLYSSNGNIIYHNNFINNTNQAYDDGINSWDNGYPSGGNYWSDFDEPGEEAYDNYRGVNQHVLGADGIVDKEYPYPSLLHSNPYNISGGNNRDTYPLMYPYPSCDINRDKKINILDLVLISRHLGETLDSGFGLAQGDANRDGVINILDMILVGEHWTG